MEFFTIGVYNTTENEFFDKLLKNKIDIFCDIRQRRGVRGSKYAFVNSNRLQEKLQALNINYSYVQNLAPTTEIRETQNEIDLEKKELKRERLRLGNTFILEYENRILNHFDFNLFFENLERNNAKKIVLFCVEEHPEACHRSLVSDKLKNDYKLNIIHL